MSIHVANPERNTFSTCTASSFKFTKDDRGVGAVAFGDGKLVDREGESLEFTDDDRLTSRSLDIDVDSSVEVVLCPPPSTALHAE
jgi:hypothetical protein